jgi:hypothetical protein
MTPPDLSGVHRKLDRAWEHIEAVHAVIDAFTGGDEGAFWFRTEQTIRPDASVLYTPLRDCAEQPPLSLGPIIGDAIHNIRSALDYLAYELSARKSRSTQFPICSDESQFRSDDTLRRIEGITGSERELIERVQPYKATNPPRHDPLAILNKLSNRDKHRLLLPYVAAVSTADSWVSSSSADISFEFIEPGPVEHDARIVALVAKPQDPYEEMYVHPQSGLRIELRDTGADDLRLELVQLLTMIHHHVRWSVVGWWFEFGQMPRTWREVRASQEDPPPA